MNPYSKLYWLTIDMSLHKALIFLFFCGLVTLTFQSIGDTLSNQKETNEKAAWVANKRKVMITTHRANYLLPITYNTNPQKTFITVEPGVDSAKYKPKKFEAKYQVSLKFPVINNLFNYRNHIFIAYTASSLWQVYSEDISSPIRNTDFNPEIFMQFHNNTEFLGLTNSFWEIGYSHHSNGKAGDASRTIETVFLKMYLEGGNFSLQPKYIQQIKVKSHTPNDLNLTLITQNADLMAYIGRFEFVAAYSYGQSLLSATITNNLSFKDNRGSITASYSYPIFSGYRSFEPIMLYIQYFNGYAENLLDYKVNNQRIGIGFAINDIF